MSSTVNKPRLPLLVSEIPSHGNEKKPFFSLPISGAVPELFPSTTETKPRLALRVWLADLTHEHGTIGADTFPLGAGCVATYAETQFAFDRPIRVFRYPSVLAQEIARQGCPDVAGFSNYMWNCALGLAFARRLKELRADILVVMGGPNYPLEPDEQERFLREHPEIDFVIMHEGEVGFATLLGAIRDCGPDKDRIIDRVPSLHALRRDGRAHLPTTTFPRLRNLDEIPSPYLAGKFDDFYDGRLWPLIQTKRGCPFTCNFCTEGESYYTKINRFSTPRIREEIDYIGKKMAAVRVQGGRSDLYIADSNFAMYPEDVETAKALARSQSLYQWPDHINTSTGKNQKQRVLEVSRLLSGSMGLSGSVQTLDPVVLQNIKRQNISAEGLMSLALEANQIGANSYCEIILGLPGETKKSHWETIQTIVTAGFNKVVPYQFMVLPGSSIGSQENQRKYHMDVRSRILPRAFGLYDLGQRTPVADIEDVCVASNTLSYADYLDCRRMHLVITIFYNDAVFETVRKILKIKGLSIFRWLELLDECLPTTRLAGLFNEFRHHTETELWKDRAELERFIQEPGTMDRYIRGELGFNLLYTFKAKALIGHLEAVREVVLRANQRLLEENGLAQSSLQTFLEETTRWDACRVTHIVDKIDREVTGTFTFDIGRFAADPQPAAEFSAYRLPAPNFYRYELNTEQKDVVQRTLNTFGADALGIGRLLSISHTKRLFRLPNLAA